MGRKQNKNEREILEGRMKEIVKIREVNDIEYKNTEKLNKAKSS